MAGRRRTSLKACHSDADDPAGWKTRLENLPHQDDRFPFYVRWSCETPSSDAHSSHLCSDGGASSPSSACGTNVCDELGGVPLFVRSPGCSNGEPPSLAGPSDDRGGGPLAVESRGTFDRRVAAPLAGDSEIANGFSHLCLCVSSRTSRERREESLRHRFAGTTRGSNR